MATYNPRSDLLSRQIQSIRDQTHSSWTCFISDDFSDPDKFEDLLTIVGSDSRFEVSRSNTRLGFYRNFERALQLSSESRFDFYALSDQDDYWYAEKLSTLLETFRPGVTLTYSDVRTVDDEGHLLLESYWHTRANNFSNFEQLLVANTITGSCCLFRADLMPYIVPFPKSIGMAFHDHWIAIVAMSIGQIAYIDRPLSDYVQHGSNVIGHARRTTHRLELRRLYPTLQNLRSTAARAERIYTSDVLRVQEFAKELGTRVGPQLSGDRQRTIDVLSHMDAGSSGIFWMARRAFGGRTKNDVTMSAERRLLVGILWKRLQPIIVRLKRREDLPTTIN